MSRSFTDYRYRLSDPSSWSDSDPFLLPSSASYPSSIENAFDFMLYAYYTVGTYRQASKRTTAYFVTDLTYSDRGDRSEQKWMRDFMLEGLNLKTHLMEMGEEYGCYGNSINWIYFPFDRHLVDMRGDFRREYALARFPAEHVTFSLDRLQYQVPDPLDEHKPLNKRKKVWLDFFDRQSTDVSRISLRKNDPRNMHIHLQDLSGRKMFVWRIRQEPWYKYLKSGNLFWVNDTPLQILEAARRDEDFVFGENQVFHLKASSVSGVSANSGWGFSDVLACYRELHNVLVYRRIDEAIGLDYMMPLRIFSPNVGPNAVQDAGMFGNLQQFRRELTNMISTYREDPFAMFATPFPISYQEANASGKALVPSENLEFAETRLLDAAGFPAEFYRGTLKVDVIAPTLRIFENQHHPLSSGLNQFVKWVATSVSQYLSQDLTIPHLERPTLVADLERRSMLLSLAASGEVSRQTAWRSIGLDNPMEEKRLRIQEDIEFDRESRTSQTAYEREISRGSIGAATQEGAAGAAPAGGGMTPVDRINEAQATAAEWAEVDVGSRRKLMDQVRATDPQMFALAKQKLEEIRAEGERQGRASAVAS